MNRVDERIVSSASVWVGRHGYFILQEPARAVSVVRTVYILLLVYEEA